MHGHFSIVGGHMPGLPPQSLRLCLACEFIFPLKDDHNFILCVIHDSFIHSGYLYSATKINLLRAALSPATAKEKCLKKLAEGRHIVPGQQAQRKELIPNVREHALNCPGLTIS